MSDFLLIHGSAHGAWCWDHVIPLLTAAGHTARAIDLPSHGKDQTSGAVVTLDMYAQEIQAAMRGKTVLVGHSMAGYPVTVAADLSPDFIDKLVYLCAHVPDAGKSIADMRMLADAQPLAAAMIPSTDGKTVTIDPALAHDILYQDVDRATSDWAIAKLCPQPVLPQTTPYTGSGHTHDRHYIRCRNDRTIPYTYQVSRTANWPSGTVSDLPTGHSPFLSAPQALAAELIRIAES